MSELQVKLLTGIYGSWILFWFVVSVALVAYTGYHHSGWLWIIVASALMSSAFFSMYLLAGENLEMIDYLEFLVLATIVCTVYTAPVYFIAGLF